MRILLLDDEGDKQRYISSFLELQGHTSEAVYNSVKMKEKLREGEYDVLVTDLKIPVAYEEEYEGLENGFEAIQYVRDTTEDICFPQRIIVVSRYLDETNTCRLNALGARGIRYDKPNGKWKQELKKELEYISLANKEAEDEVNKKNMKADIVILTFIDNEKNQLRKIFNWKQLSVKKDPLEYYSATADNEQKTKLVHCHTSCMGAVASSQATTRAIELFDPDMIIICGIAGGRPGKTNFGDIVLVQTSVNFAVGSIEESTEGDIKFLPDSDEISMEPLWIRPFRNYKDNLDLLRKIRDSANLTEEYDHDIRLHIGKIATGPAVIKSENFAEKYIKSHNRQYIAVDMETYGMYYAAQNLSRRFLSIKGISDNADKAKNDNHQKFAALAAANLVKHFILNDYSPCR